MQPKMPSSRHARAWAAIRRAGVARVAAVAFPLLFLAYILSSEILASRALHASSLKGVSVGGGAAVSTTLAAQRAADDKAAAAMARSMVPQRRWSGQPPPWCASLMESPRPWRKACGRSRFGAVCRDGAAQFFGVHGRDLFLWAGHWRHLHRRGRYVDIAASEPVTPSNTYFFDRCLGWDGVCVEAQPSWRSMLTRHRSCAVVPGCVRDRGAKKGAAPKLKCVRTAVALRAAIPDDVAAVDMLSVDVGGDEVEVLSGIDWGRAKISVIVIETVSADTLSLLEKLGYALLDESLRNANTSLGKSNVFLHKDAVWGKPQ